MNFFKRIERCIRNTCIKDADISYVDFITTIFFLLLMNLILRRIIIGLKKTINYLHNVPSFGDIFKSIIFLGELAVHFSLYIFFALQIFSILLIIVSAFKVYKRGYKNNSSKLKNSYVEVYKKEMIRCFDLRGCSNREDFLVFIFLNFFFFINISLLIASFGINAYTLTLLGISTVFFIWPYIAISIRRLHDVGFSGYWILIRIIPFIGHLLIIVFMFVKGKKDHNKYRKS